jgi:hypothetical protein
VHAQLDLQPCLGGIIWPGIIGIGTSRSATTAVQSPQQGDRLRCCGARTRAEHLTCGKPSPLSHNEVTEAKRRAAIRAGAQPVGMREFPAIIDARVFDDKWQNLNPRRRLVIEWTAQL